VSGSKWGCCITVGQVGNGPILTVEAEVRIGDASRGSASGSQWEGKYSFGA
jgi:hypothetical protein